MYVSYFPARNGRTMDTDRYPTGSRVDVWWADYEEWYAATVLKTRTMTHTIDRSPERTPGPYGSAHARRREQGNKRVNEKVWDEREAPVSCALHTTM